MFIILQGSTLYSKVFKNIRYIFSFCSKFLKQNRKSLQHAALTCSILVEIKVHQRNVKARLHRLPMSKRGF